MKFCVLLLICYVAIATGSWVKQMENPGLYEGDMILSPEQQQLANNGHLGYATTKTNHWPRTIYYDWAPERANNRGILAAIADYHKYTCLRFIKRTNQKDYMYFYRGGGCFSGVGFFGGRQSISIGPGCDGKGTVMHEMAHSLEPNSPAYIELTECQRTSGWLFSSLRRVDWSFGTKKPINCMAGNFRKQSSTRIDSYGTPYDLLSMMHYPDWAFSHNGKPTIITKDKTMQKKIGQRGGFSEIDKIQVNRMYKCGTTPTKPPKRTTTTKRATNPPVTGSFALQHSGGRCLSVNSQYQIIFTTSCRTKFTLNNGKLRVAGSSKCAQTGSYNNAFVNVINNCGHTFKISDMESSGYFALKHVQTGKCIHPFRGTSQPPENRRIVIYSGCNEKRLKFRKV